MTFKFIQLAIADGIALLTLDQPDSRNGLTVAMQDEIRTALEQLRDRDDVRALILTGAGKSFCAGADLGRLDAGGGASVGQSVATIIEESSKPLILALQNLPFPVVSAVNGAALMDEARKIATRLARAPSHSALEARRALDAAGSQGLAAQLDYEKERQRELLDLPSFREGVSAFFEKREPVFRR